MTRYKSPRLTDQTPERDPSKLVSSVKSVAGVSAVALNPTTSEINISFDRASEPKEDLLVAAMAKAGFKIADRS